MCRLKKLIFFIISFIIIMPTGYCSMFEVTPLTDKMKQQMQTLGTWKKECPIAMDRLRLIKFSYYDFSGIEQENGQMVVLDVVSNRVLKIFKELHSIKFPIARSYPIEHYKGNDDESMLDNNSSCYNCRFITGMNNIPSIHSYGLAIDINPIQNPYLGFNGQEENFIKILPNSGKEYANRNNLRPGMVESIIEIFKKNGFTDWGGKWIYPRAIDWQHFQLPRPLAQLLVAMSFKDAKEFFEIYSIAKSPIFNFGEYDPVDTNKFVELYIKDPKKFMATFRNKKNIFDSNTTEALKELENFV
ncbi:MAG: M15 family metallopeptidase [Gammaproteobacteria bacterium]